jgi:TetR/AcrR family transcriptional regulator, transcriptional repressor of aconitase
MPRVSAEYLEQRREQILGAAQRCFARKGFYETSMQDVFRESGLSAGAVYRYFKSKDELIQAISAGVLGQMAAALDAALAEDPVPGPGQLVGRLAAAVQELSGQDGPARVALPAWAAALHDPGVAVIARDMLGSLRARWVQAAQRMREDGRLPPSTDVQAVGAALFALLPGFLLQHLLLQDIDAATFSRGVSELFAVSSAR